MYESKPFEHQDIVAGIITLGVIGAIGYVLNAARKMHRIAAKLGVATEAILNSANIEISEKLINDTVQREAEWKIRHMLDKVADEAAHDTMETVKDTIAQKVDDAVSEAYADVKDSVRKELDRRVGQVDISSVKQEVIERAKSEAARIFKASLDNILEDFNGNLKNVTAIYSSMAKAVLDKG